MSVSTISGSHDALQLDQHELDALAQIERELETGVAASREVLPAAKSRSWNPIKFILILVAFVAAGFAGAMFGSSIGGTATPAPQSSSTGSTIVVSANPAPSVKSGPAVKAVSRQTTQVGTTSKVHLGIVPKSTVKATTGTATVTSPSTGTSAKADPQPATKPDPVTKPTTGGPTGTTTTTTTASGGSGGAVPPTTTSSGSTGTTSSGSTTVVNSSPDGAGTTGDAVNDQGTGDTSTGSQMPAGTGPGQYNSGDNTGPSF